MPTLFVLLKSPFFASFLFFWGGETFETSSCRLRVSFFLFQNHPCMVQLKILFNRILENNHRSKKSFFDVNFYDFRDINVSLLRKIYRRLSLATNFHFHMQHFFSDYLKYCLLSYGSNRQRSCKQSCS